MKLGTLRDGPRDGRLVVVSSDNQRYTKPDSVLTMQAALDDWEEARPALESAADKLDSGRLEGQPVSLDDFDAPLPRAYEWIDGSAYINHIVLVRKARGAEPPETLETDPLVYQGGSGNLLGPTEDIPCYDVDWGLDFESEICVVLGDTPQNVSADEAEQHVKLLTLCNDLTYRHLIPDEIAKSFGFFQSKPATAFAPFLVTPDELGDAWRNGRLHRRLRTHYNDELFGDPEAGPEMHFSFHDLIEHITKTRSFTSGTIRGSGTVANEDRDRGSSCLAEQRKIEEIEHGEASTSFMRPGDTVRIEMLDDDGTSIFGTIEQRVVEPE